MNPESIYVTHWGTTGPRVVMVHGSAQGSRNGGDHHFSRQRQLGEAGWQLLVPDRPGHGRTPAPGRPDDAQADGAWVAEMLGSGAHLVGHSFGGCVALAAAAKRPAAVFSLTLIEPGMQKLAMNQPVVRRFGLQLLAAIYLSFSAAQRARRFAELVRIPPEVGGGRDEAELRAMGQGIKQLKVPSAKELQQQLDVIREAGIPLLVVTGGWSPAFEATADTVASAGGGRRLVIPCEHHFPQLASDQFNEALAAFMTSSPSKK